jgi:hypothetical protein
MLINLLELIAQGKAHSYAGLAKQLGVSEALLRSMIEDLARKGYLLPLGADGQRKCGTCGGCSGYKPLESCPSDASTRPLGWALTPKGLETARREK